jgi:hypothetical protein
LGLCDFDEPQLPPTELSAELRRRWAFRSKNPKIHSIGRFLLPVRLRALPGEFRRLLRQLLLSHRLPFVGQQLEAQKLHLLVVPDGISSTQGFAPVG